MKIETSSLGTCAVVKGGDKISLGLVDENGQPIEIKISASEACAIAMTLPSLLKGLLRAKYSDDTRLALGITHECLTQPLPASELLGVGTTFASNLSQVERTVVQNALARTGGNVSAAARYLGISRAPLHRKLNASASTVCSAGCRSAATDQRRDLHHSW